MLKLAFIAALALVAASTLVSAQSSSAFLKIGAAGSTSSVVGTLVPASKLAVNPATDMAAFIKGWVTPYVFTAAELASSAGPIWLIALPDSNPQGIYQLVWNFTTAESDTIRTWAATQPARNNLVVAFSATWNSEGRFAIDTIGWAFAVGSLLPYGEAAGCNATAALLCLGALQASIPLNCIDTGLPALKKCVIDHEKCLIHVAKGLGLVKTFCETNKQAVDTLFCSDGKVGGDAICAYTKCAVPNGKPNADGSVVATVGPNGIATSGSACATMGNSAGSIFFGAVVAVVGIVAAIL